MRIIHMKHREEPVSESVTDRGECIRAPPPGKVKARPSPCRLRPDRGRPENDYIRSDNSEHCRSADADAILSSTTDSFDRPF
ncbi:hypothetical protein EVAR_12921_1 [Eumeta japonica]|uniref:Uncharacterized protein n=1 Tax=Eumeta variegata TaxID=151549 RepID=A0A4C1TVW6_EUMVA|nr:hypothetical protein EVAR_12921_1 [Eumeta japonica]